MSILFWKAPIRPTSMDCFVLWYIITTRHDLYCIVASRLIVVIMIPRPFPCSPRKKQSSHATWRIAVVHQQSTIKHDTTHFIVSTLLTSSRCSIQRPWYTVMAVSVTETRLKGMNRLGGRCPRTNSAVSNHVSTRQSPFTSNTLLQRPLPY
jgi:hypothetical protein